MYAFQFRKEITASSSPGLSPWGRRSSGAESKSCVAAVRSTSGYPGWVPHQRDFYEP
jgi:hypothetical protein